MYLTSFDDVAIFAEMALPCCSNNVHIERTKNVSKSEFEDKYLSKGVPVIIEDATDHWLARKWTLDSLCEKVGDNEIIVRGQTNEDAYRTGKNYVIRKTTFNDYVSDLKAENARARSSYMAVQNLKQTFPQIEADVPLPDYVGKLHLGPYMWVALKGHYEFCHIDPDDNFLVMIQGRKQVRLFGCDLRPMYPNPKGSKGKTIQAQVNCDNPALERFPEFRNATCYHCVLDPGDMLFIPAFWWHQVTSLDTSISVNIFFGDAGDNKYFSKILSSSQWPAFSYWFLNIIEQNRNHASFPRILARLPEVLHHFFLKQWHEIITPDQIQILVQLVLDYLCLDSLPTVEDRSKYPPPLKIRGLMWR